MKRLHVVPDLDVIGNGMSVAAHLIADAAGDDLMGAHRFAKGKGDIKVYDEVWVHSCWLPSVLLSSRRVIKAGKQLVCMPHGNLDPVRLGYHAWKKCLVGPFEHWALCNASRIVATCKAESEWIRAYEPRVKAIEVIDLKQYFRLPAEQAQPSIAHNFLYLGREHPLKGLEYLEAAVRSLKFEVQSSKSGCRGEELSDCQIDGLSDCCSRAGGVMVQSDNQTIKQSDNELTNSQLTTHNLQLKIVSAVFGEEKEKIWSWCDVLVLPTLSENFGLVVAEALERGKRVITTDGAPAWGDGNTYGGRLTYLNGYRDGTPADRVSMLKSAILSLTTCGANSATVATSQPMCSRQAGKSLDASIKDV